MAKKNNLLIRIQSYTPREGRNPKEDFFTEVFADLIHNEEFLKVFLEIIKQPGNIDNPSIRGHPGREIDLEIKGTDYCLMVENKLDHTLQEHQPETYENEWKGRNASSGGWILITRDYGEFEGLEKYSRFQGHFYWYSIYEGFNQYCYEKENNKTWEKDPIGYYLIKQFLDYMEEERMTPISIDENDGEKVLRSLRILKQIDEILGDVKKEIMEYKINWDSKEGIGKINEDYRCLFFTSSELYYCIQFDINVNGRKLTPTVYVQLDDHNEGMGCIEAKSDSKNIKKFLENEKEWNGNPFKLDDDGHWLGRSMDMSELYKERNATKQRQKIKDFFGDTLKELADKGLIDRINL